MSRTPILTSSKLYRRDNEMQDPNPLPWGALDRYQAHFIVRKDVGSFCW